MKPVVEAFAFTLSFPGADEEYVLFVYDALKSREDSHFRVAMDVDGRIHVSFHPLYANGGTVSNLSERASAYGSELQRIVESALEEASRRYRLYRDLSRIDEVLSEGRYSAVLEDIVPSIW